MLEVRRVMLATSVFLAGASAVQAQGPEQSAVVVAAGYVRTNSDLRELGDSELVLDQRVADVTGKLTNVRARSETAAILRALGARRMGTKEQEMVCTGSSPKDCRLRPQVKGIVALSAPRLDGEKASVDLHMWWDSGSADEPVATKQLIVDLERVDGAWRVKGTRQLRIN